jgi:protein TonB
MTRMQKKCLVVSSALHVLLLGILLFGAALMPAKKEPPITRLNVVDLSKISDAPSSSGGPAGAPVSTPVPPKQETQPPPPVASPVPQPAAEPPPVKPPPTAAKPPEVSKPDKTPIKPPSDEFTMVKRTTPPKKPTDNHQADEQAQKDQEQKERERRDQLAKAFGTATDGLKGKFSPQLQVDMPPGGGGGEASVNYRDLVAKIYTDKWIPPASLEDDTATVTTSVTIARDGFVTSHRVTKSSGNIQLDKSIEATLDNVKFIAPFPAGSRDAERTFNIKFNLQAKRGLG